MTSEGPHHPGQQPDEVPPGAGGSASYGDRSAQQENGYASTAPDLGWAPPPPAARPSPAVPAWTAPGEPPPTVAWQAPGGPQPGPWGSHGGQPQPGTWGGPADQPQPPAWNTQADQQQPTATWAAAPVPQQQPAWGQGEPTQPGGQPTWGLQPPHQAWPAQGEQAQPAQGGQQPTGEPRPQASWDPPAEPTQGMPWQPPPPQAQQPGWGPQGQREGQPPAWTPPEPPGDQQPRAWGSASVRPQADQQPTAAWAPAPAAAWAAAPAPVAPPPQEQRTGWDAEPDQPRPADSWSPAEPAATPTARATASVPRGDAAPAWHGSRPGDDALPPRPVVPEGEPWSAEKAWGGAGTDSARDEAPRADWEQTPAESSYQPSPAPGVSPANMVPLPPQEARVPGASLAAAAPVEHGRTPEYAQPAERDNGFAPGHEPAHPGDDWAGEPSPSASSVIPHPRTSPEIPPGADPAGTVSASASVPLSNRVMPPADQALRPPAMPAPQPRVYGRPVHSQDGPGEVEPGGQLPEQQRFQPPGEPEPRVEGGTHGRFGDHHDQPPYGPGAFGEATVASAPHAPLPAFPPGIPSFADPVPHQRPVNGTKPHSEPTQALDPFSDAASPSGGMPGGAPTAGHGPEDTRPGFPPAFPQHGPERPLWDLGDSPDPEQARYDAFKPNAEEAKPAEQPAPKVRNGRVLMAVLTAAVLILVVPLGLLWLLGKTGGDSSAFNPAVGSCVKQSGAGAVAAGCGDDGAFRVVSRVDAKEKCADPAQPHVVLPGDTATRVLCLAPATAG